MCDHVSTQNPIENYSEYYLAERNYDIGDRELLALKLAFKKWRHWLKGATDLFLILTDHQNLEYIPTAWRLNPRQARSSGTLAFRRTSSQTVVPNSHHGPTRPRQCFVPMSSAQSNCVHLCHRDWTCCPGPRGEEQMMGEGSGG
ncbi:uncharacterized protein ACWYII_005133 [Salvelinus alpinus]